MQQHMCCPPACLLKRWLGTRITARPPPFPCFTAAAAPASAAAPQPPHCSRRYNAQPMVRLVLGLEPDSNSRGEKNGKALFSVRVLDCVCLLHSRWHADVAFMQPVLGARAVPAACCLVMLMCLGCRCPPSCPPAFLTCRCMCGRASAGGQSIASSSAPTIPGTLVRCTPAAAGLPACPPSLPLTNRSVHTFVTQTTTHSVTTASLYVAACVPAILPRHAINPNSSCADPLPLHTCLLPLCCRPQRAPRHQRHRGGGQPAQVDDGGDAVERRRGPHHEGAHQVLVRSSKCAMQRRQPA